MEKKEQNVNSAALEYMEQKYGEKFEYAGPWGDSLSGTHELFVKCASLPEQKILVQVENYKQADKVFRDNYLAVKYQPETMEFIDDCAIKVFGQATIFYDVADDGLSPDLPANALFEEFLADAGVPLVIMVEAKTSNFSVDEQAEDLAKLIAANGTSFYLSVVIVDDSAYGTYDRKALNEQIALRQFVRCAKITSIGGIIQTEWLGKE